MEGGETLDAELEKEVLELQGESKDNRWDVETVLTTYSNIYNHPTLIKDVKSSAPKIRFSKGIPIVVPPTPPHEGSHSNESEEDSDEEYPHEGFLILYRSTLFLLTYSFFFLVNSTN